jgi:hypothetical protein
LQKTTENLKKKFNKISTKGVMGMNKESLNKRGAFILIVFLLSAAIFFVGLDLVRAQDERPEGSDRRPQQSVDQGAIVDADRALEPLYHFSGVYHSPAMKAAVSVFCTNLDETAATSVRVEIYNFNGLFEGSGNYFLYPYQTATIETSPTAFYFTDASMDISEIVNQGYGRILTNHKNVVCSAQGLDSANSPPTWMINLPLYGRSGWGNFLPLITN